MAQTTGLVQRLTIIPAVGTAGFCCAWIGPSPTNTALLFVQRLASDSAQTGDFKTSIVDGLVSAQASRREVVAGHADISSEITSLEVYP
jgi:hypothetical protein